MAMEGGTNLRKARSLCSRRYRSGNRNDGKGLELDRLINPTRREIGLNEHFISVNLGFDIRVKWG